MDSLVERVQLQLQSHWLIRNPTAEYGSQDMAVFLVYLCIHYVNQDDKTSEFQEVVRTNLFFP